MPAVLWMSVNICLATETYSQETFFTIESNNLTVKEVLNKIEKESEYIFFYMDNSVDLNRKVSVKAEKEQVSKILDQIFEGTNTHYYISDRQIIISKDEKAAVPVSLQQKGQTITGIVKDATGEPVIGANIIEKGTTNGTITDMNGRFTLTVTPKAILQISYIGFNTQEVPVGNKASLTIKLAEDTKALDEVVVVGYGVMRKSDLTGSVGSVKSDVIQKQAISSFDQGLQGKVAGVQVMATSGSPGGVVDIRIRGGNSLTSGNQPLYVIDGYPVTAGGSAGGSGAGQNPLATLNPGDIESTEILKDASATSIYGSRGANGVILITTKRGKTGKTTVTYD
ncbi:MAG: TonB-dependent receptor plug domain-containing protein [Parabacteroides sp.]|nr:TonB-dependent receptor plug domain-containing protein [Parabacteroides sp.]